MYHLVPSVSRPEEDIGSHLTEVIACCESGSHLTEVTACCESPCGCWESKLCPLDEQQMLRVEASF